MMMQILVENIKCGGCANSIKKKLQAELNTSHIVVDVENGSIDIDIEEDKRAHAVEVLAQLGYPETGENSLGKKAKSFVSCAVGRMSSNEG